MVAEQHPDHPNHPACADTRPITVVGGGVAGLGAALACARAGHRVELLEQASTWTEVGAGIQLGPNAVRVLASWGLLEPLRACAAFPEALHSSSAATGQPLGTLPLGQRAVARYGQPYATIHRADLQALLLAAVQQQSAVTLHPARRITDAAHVASLRQHTPLLLGCDGIWSAVRQAVLNDGPPTFTGHLAYRGLLPMADVPSALRHNAVRAWLGRDMHAVHYPVRSGQWMNVVVVVHGVLPPGADAWDNAAVAADLQDKLARAGASAPALRDLVAAVPAWRLWPLYDREPMTGAHQHLPAAGQGRGAGTVALLGDAAHPMRPYLAQGAAMALEDAWALGQSLGAPNGLAQWARTRWQRNAWVQARARRNGQIFHASGFLRWGRDAGLAVLGARLMDVPRLYSGPPFP
jgi:salicylate hydroxylase